MTINPIKRMQDRTESKRQHMLLELKAANQHITYALMSEASYQSSKK
jgi:hypothetical protein